MGLFKTQRKVYAPVRYLAITVTVSVIVVFASRGSPVLPLSTSSLYPSGQYSDPGVFHIAEIDTGNVPEERNQSSEAGNSGRTESCLKYVFYDKPVKTGSSAVTAALEKYLITVSEPAIVCLTQDECTRASEEVCAGARPDGHLIEHVTQNSSLGECLRSRGYYHLTSIREPKERIISAWRYSLTKKVSHYGIPYDAPFTQFLQLFPRCALYSYYDKLAARCTREEAEQRAVEIASRFDEVIDLSDAVISDVHRRIQPFLQKVNVAPTGRAKTGEMEVPNDIVELEYILYNKLREKRVRLAERPNRVFCER